MDGLNQFTDGYALIIGVGADLPVTVVDAGAINDILIDPARAGYPPQNVKLLTEANATRANILTAFDELAKSVALNPRATVIIYYSGHGGFDKRDDEYYLVPFGFKPADRVNTGITAQEFTAKINAINSQKLVTFLDCCHAGGMVIKKDIQDTEFLKYIKDDNFTEKSPIDLVQQLGQGQGRVFIASSLANEYSIAAKPYSIFTECLIKALAGEGSVENNEGYARIFEVTGYLLTAVPQRSAEFPPNTETQHPILKYADLTQNFPLCYYAGGNRKKIGSPTEPSPVSFNSQNENLTIYGVIYERIAGRRRPASDLRVKIPIKESYTRTNFTGNFLLTNVPKESTELDVFWNDGIHLLPINEKGIYEVGEENNLPTPPQPPPPTNFWKIRLRVLAILAILALSVFAGGLWFCAGRVEQKRSFEGRIVNEKNEPIKNAEIFCSLFETNPIKTDEFGAFSTSIVLTERNRIAVNNLEFKVVYQGRSVTFKEDPDSKYEFPATTNNNNGYLNGNSIKKTASCGYKNVSLSSNITSNITGTLKPFYYEGPKEKEFYDLELSPKIYAYEGEKLIEVICLEQNENFTFTNIPTNKNISFWFSFPPKYQPKEYKAENFGKLQIRKVLNNQETNLDKIVSRYAAFANVTEDWDTANYSIEYLKKQFSGSIESIESYKKEHFQKAGYNNEKASFFDKNIPVLKNIIKRAEKLSPLASDISDKDLLDSYIQIIKDDSVPLQIRKDAIRSFITPPRSSSLQYAEAKTELIEFFETQLSEKSNLYSLAGSALICLKDENFRNDFIENIVEGDVLIKEKLSALGGVMTNDSNLANKIITKFNAIILSSQISPDVKKHALRQLGIFALNSLHIAAFDKLLEIIKNKQNDLNLRQSAIQVLDSVLFEIPDSSISNTLGTIKKDMSLLRNN